MPNMQPKKTPMAEQAPDIRNKNFAEVALGYTAEEAVNEAERCLQCKHRPCVDGCPVNVQIPEFIAKVAEGDFAAAYNTIAETNALPAVCGRVCPQESQCEARCVRGIKGEPVAIGRLERFVADWARENGMDRGADKPVPLGIKVAVVGAGPAGLSCAGDLAKRGYEVTVFEAFHQAGGVLSYGIPEFRLPKEIVDREIDGLRNIGVEIQTDMVIGRAFTVEELFDMGYKAVFIGSGAGLPRFMNIPGENLTGVFASNDFLTRINLMKAYLPEYDTPLPQIKSAAIVGGGNVAMDAARCAKRIGSENVYVLYRRGKEEMPARAEEIHHAQEEGIEFRYLVNPVRILPDNEGRVAAIECVRMELGEPDESGRRAPVAVEGSEFTLPVDAVIMSIGNTPNPLIRSTTPEIEADRRGCLVVQDDLATTKSGVYAGGDVVTGAATVILAMGAGKQAAESIHEYLQKT